MKSFGLWLLSVTMLGLTLGCGDATDDKKIEPAPSVTDPADPVTPPADTTTP